MIYLVNYGNRVQIWSYVKLVLDYNSHFTPISFPCLKKKKKKKNVLGVPCCTLR
jgi:hypothetical protein